MLFILSSTERVYGLLIDLVSIRGGILGENTKESE